MDDADPALRTSVSDTQSSTGVNGIGMVIGLSGLPQISGQGGGLPGGCSWATGQGATIPGLMFFSERIAVTTGTSTPCP
jgi:hypothetical protein